MELSHSLVLNEEALAQIPEPKKPVFVYEWLRFLNRILPVTQKQDIKGSQDKLVEQLKEEILKGPGPPTRVLLARCLATLFSVGDTFRLFQTINVCNDVLKNKDDSPSQLPTKLCAMCCIGAMYEKLGRMVGRSFEDTAQILVKALKNAESQARAEIMLTFEKMISGLGSAGVSVHKDIYKAAKVCMTDRVMSVRAAAASCLTGMVSEAQFLWTTELENGTSTCFKALEGSNYEVRCAVAKLLGTLLATAHNPSRLKGGLGGKSQKSACRELGVVIAEQLNSIDFSVEASVDRVLTVEILATQHILICALLELGALVQQIGTAVTPLFVEASGIMEPVFAALLHPCRPARVAAAWCLRCVTAAVPSQLTPLIDRCLSRLEHMKASPDALSGYSLGLCSLLGGSYQCPLGIPYCKGRQVFGAAEELLRTATQSTRLATVKTQAGWLLLASVMTLGPSVVKHHLPRMLLLWKNAFPRSAKEAEAEKLRGDAFTWLVTLEARAGALCGNIIREHP